MHFFVTSLSERNINLMKSPTFVTTPPKTAPPMATGVAHAAETK